MNVIAFWKAIGGLLSFLWDHKEKVAIGLGVAAVAWLLWSWHERGDDINELKKENKGYQEVVKDMREWHDETVDALERKADDDKERAQFEQRQKAQTAADRAAGDGALAPVLVHGLHDLQQRQADRNKRDTR